MPTPFHRLTAKEKTRKFWDRFRNDQKPPIDGTLDQITAVLAFAEWCDAEDAKSIHEAGAMDREVARSLRRES